MDTTTRFKAIEGLRKVFAEALVDSSPRGEKLFLLADLMMCGMMGPDDQVSFLNQAVSRGLLEPETFALAAPFEASLATFVAEKATNRHELIMVYMAESGDACVFLNGEPLVVERGTDIPAIEIESTAQKLSAVLGVPVQTIKMAEPSNSDWAWGDVAELLPPPKDPYPERCASAAEKLVSELARMAIWHGRAGKDECQVPSDGHEDSHNVLMRLINSARDIEAGRAPGADLSLLIKLTGSMVSAIYADFEKPSLSVLVARDDPAVAEEAEVVSIEGTDYALTGVKPIFNPELVRNVFPLSQEEAQEIPSRKKPSSGLGM